VLSFALAHFLRFDGLPKDPSSLAAFYQLLPWAVLTRLPVFIGCGFYYVLIRYMSFYDIKRVIQGAMTASGIFIVAAYLLGLTVSYPRGVFVIDWFALTTLLVGYRALAKKLYLRYKAQPAQDAARIPVLIWGAGDCGELCLRYLQKEQDPSYDVVGFIDDSPKKRGKRLGGVKVLGDRHHLEIISQLYKVKQIFIAVANTSQYELQKMLEHCGQAGLQPRLFLEKCKPGTVCPMPTSAPVVANGYGQGQASPALLDDSCLS